MPSFETAMQRLQRERDDRKRFPELEFGDYDEIAELDGFSRSQGQQPSTFGQAADNASARIGFTPVEVDEIERETRFRPEFDEDDPFGGTQPESAASRFLGRTPSGPRTDSFGLQEAQARFRPDLQAPPDIPTEFGAGADGFEGLGGRDAVLPPGTPQEFRGGRFESLVERAATRIGDLEDFLFTGNVAAATDALSQMVDGERLIDTTISRFTFGNKGINDIPGYESSPRIVQELVSALAPINAFAAGEGKAITDALRTAAGAEGRSVAAQRALNGIATVTEPFSSATVQGRFAREAAVDVAAQEGFAVTEGAPTGARFAAGLAGGVLAGGLTDPRVARNLVDTGPKALPDPTTASRAAGELPRGSVLPAIDPDTGQVRGVRAAVGGAPDDLAEAQEMARRAFASEQELRAQGIPQAELQAGRSRQAAQMQSREAQGRAMGLTGTELNEFVSEGARMGGTFRQTVAPAVEWTPAQRSAIDQRAVDVVGEGDVAPQVLRSVNEAVNRIQYGRGLRAFELDPTTSTGRMLRATLGDEVVDAVARSRPVIPDKPGFARPLRGGESLPGGPPVAPPTSRTGIPGAPQSSRLGTQKIADPFANIPPERPPFIPDVPERAEALPGGPQTRALPDDGGDLPPPSAGIPAAEGQVPPPRNVPPGFPESPDDLERTLRRHIIDQVVSIATIPRAVLASFDISAPGRQGLPFVRRGAWWTSWEPMMRSLVNREFADGLMDDLLGGPRTAQAAAAGDFQAQRSMALAAQADASGLSMTRYGPDAVDMSLREERFISRWAEKIPGIQASERAYVAFLNKLRRGVFDDYADRVNRAVAEGTMTAEKRATELREMSRHINISTGRSDLSARQASSDLLVAGNATFFSPRLNIGRVQAFGNLFRAISPTSSLSRRMRFEIAADYATFVGQGIAVLEIMNLLGWVDVELDPRSSDFGKGVTDQGDRFEPWAGFQPIVRYTAQILSNQRKAGNGEIETFEGNRLEPIGRFIRSKFDPGIPAITWDLLTGQNFLGDPIDLSTREGIQKEITDRFIPLAPADIIEGAAAEGLLGALKGAVSLVGVGYARYLGYGDVLDFVAREQFDGQDYDDLNKGDRDTVKADPRAQAKLDEIREDVPIDLGREARSGLFSQNDENMARIEEHLAERIAAGVTGESLRSEIKSFKFERFTASQAIFEGRLSEFIETRRTDEPIEDVLADLYWSAPVPESVTELGDLRLDFDTRDEYRGEVLAQAESLGVDPFYITGTGLGTYRGTRFEDETVRAAVEDAEAFNEALDQTGFFDLKDVAWLDLRDRHPDILGADEFADYWGWRDQEVAALTRRNIGELGVNPESARDEAEREVAGYDTVAGFNEFFRTEYRHQWVVDNKELALRAMNEGWFSPDKAERTFLRDVQ